MISGRLTTLFAFERFHHCPAASRRAAQQSLPVAVAIADAATAEGSRRAVIKLVFAAAMVGAVKAAAEAVIGAMVAKPPRQRRRILPVRQDEPRARRPCNGLLCGRCRRPGDADQKSKPKCFHRPSTTAEGEPEQASRRSAKESSGDRRRVHRRSRLDSSRRPPRHCRRSLDRQPYGEAGALPFPALHLDAAAMQIDGHLD